MTKEAISTERALKLALDALDEFCELGAIIRPLEVRDALRVALASRGEALANEALDRMSENARELGLDYEPLTGTQISKGWWDGEKLMAKPIPFVEFYKPAPATELREQEPVGYVAENGVIDWNVCAPPIMTDLYTTPQPAQPQQEPVATVIGKFLTRKDELRTCIEPELPLGTKLYTSPPTLSLAQSGREALEAAHTRLQKKYGELEGKVRRTWAGLTDEEVSKMPAWIYSPDQDGMTAEEGLEVFARAIEANLKEKNSD